MNLFLIIGVFALAGCMSLKRADSTKNSNNRTPQQFVEEFTLEGCYKIDKDPKYCGKGHQRFMGKCFFDYDSPDMKIGSVLEDFVRSKWPDDYRESVEQHECYSFNEERDKAHREWNKAWIIWDMAQYKYDSVKADLRMAKEKKDRAVKKAQSASDNLYLCKERNRDTNMYPLETIYPTMRRERGGRGGSVQ